MASNPTYNHQFGDPSQQQPQNAWPPGYSNPSAPYLPQPGYPAVDNAAYPPTNSTAAYPPPQVGFYPPPSSVPMQAPPSYDESTKASNNQFENDPYGGQIISFSNKSIRMGMS